MQPDLRYNQHRQKHTGMVQDAWSTLPKAQSLHISAAIVMSCISERTQKAYMVLQDECSCPWLPGASYN